MPSEATTVTHQNKRAAEKMPLAQRVNFQLVERENRPPKRNAGAFCERFVSPMLRQTDRRVLSVTIQPLIRISKVGGASGTTKVSANSEVTAFFFEPARDCLAAHPKGAGQAAQRSTLLISRQNLFPLFWGVTIGLRVRPTHFTAIWAKIALFTVFGSSVTYGICAVTMITILRTVFDKQSRFPFS